LSPFERFERNGGYFISRLESGANPLAGGVKRNRPGRSVRLVGERLQDVLEREVLDPEVEVRIQGRRYRRRRRTVRRMPKVLRPVGGRDPDTGTHHLYVINARPGELAAEHTGRSYAQGWEVELAFRELRPSRRPEVLPSRKPQVVEALIYAAALTLMVSRCLLHPVHQALGAGAERVKSRRWAILVSTIVADLLRLVLNPSRKTRNLDRDLRKLLRFGFPSSPISRLYLPTGQMRQFASARMRSTVRVEWVGPTAGGNRARGPGHPGNEERVAQVRLDRRGAREESIGQGIAERAKAHLVDRALLLEQVQDTAHLLAVAGG
jgi:hypothetical protein